MDSRQDLDRLLSPLEAEIEMDASNGANHREMAPRGCSAHSPLGILNYCRLFSNDVIPADLPS